MPLFPQRPELLAPAGTPEKLKTALHFGADAVYLGLKQFSLRAGAGNFSLEQLASSLALAHGLGRKVYVALNLQPFDADLEQLVPTLKELARLGPDALIVADPGVITLCHEHCPELPLHLSTQASVTNTGAARFWSTRGKVDRIIAARELSLSQLAAMVAAARPCGFEAFAHGAVCLAYSGRCLLSLYWASLKRDPRRGSCAQGCRFRYRLIEDTRRPGEANPVEQDHRGTYFFDARDLCTLPILDELVATGVQALKLEGRTRSALYLGVTVDVYRHALDRIASGEQQALAEETLDLLDQLRAVSPRPFSTHFYTGDQDREESYLPHGMPGDGAARYAGQVVEGGLLELKNPIRPGARVTLCDRGLLREEVTLSPLVAEDGTALEKAAQGVRVKLPEGCRVGPGALAMYPQAATATPTIQAET